jgi:hypothetical protein
MHAMTHSARFEPTTPERTGFRLHARDGRTRQGNLPLSSGTVSGLERAVQHVSSQPLRCMFDMPPKAPFGRRIILLRLHQPVRCSTCDHPARNVRTRGSSMRGRRTQDAHPATATSWYVTSLAEITARTGESLQHPGNGNSPGGIRRNLHSKLPGLQIPDSTTMAMPFCPQFGADQSAATRRSQLVPEC